MLPKPENDVRVPLTVLIPCKNEALNLAKSLASVVGWADEIIVLDSHSSDESSSIAEAAGAPVVQFDYKGGWPKKRQWALDNLAIRNEWVLLLDADEILPPALKDEIHAAINDADYDGYLLALRVWFLGRLLWFGDTVLYKLSLFRHGKGHFECRFADQDVSMCDMEVHEHVVVSGKVRALQNPVRHENVNSLGRYIEKHNAYSNWEARVYTAGITTELRPSLFGNQAQRRRWLKSFGMRSPIFPALMFLYTYILRLGFLDGAPGFIYCGFKAAQAFHTYAKIVELRFSPMPSAALARDATQAPRQPADPPGGDQERTSEYFSQMASRWSIKYLDGGSMAPRIDRCLGPLRGRIGGGGAVLDFGCGTGEIALALDRSGFRVTAVDVSHAMIDVAARASVGTKIELISIPAGRWSHIPVPAGTYDAAVASSVLEYVVDPVEQLRELARVVRADGLLVMTVPNPHHIYRWMERPIRAILKAYVHKRVIRSVVAHLPRKLEAYCGYLALSRNHFSLSCWQHLLRESGFSVESVTQEELPLARIVSTVTRRSHAAHI